MFTVKNVILKSNAGYYIGGITIDEEGGYSPYSRDSGYYRTYELARRDFPKALNVQQAFELYDELFSGVCVSTMEELPF